MLPNATVSLYHCHRSAKFALPSRELSIARRVDFTDIAISGRTQEMVPRRNCEAAWGADCNA